MARVANCIPLVTTFVQVLEPGDAGYPRRLVARAFGTLHVRGAIGERPALAIVGARAASGLGMERAHAIGRHLAGRGVDVVSGGALGIDGAAHRGALEGAGATTVVLGSGITVMYPARHARLFQQIIERGGALVSMYPRDAQPKGWMFTRRNSLIAALADAVLVVEADVRSGSLSTAKAARDQGRLVAAWPGSRGCDQLLARGAAVVESMRDVDQLVAGSPRLPVAAPLDATASAIRAAIDAGATDVDAIVNATGLPVRTVLRALPQLARML